MSVVQTVERTPREIFPSQLGPRNEELRNEVQDTQDAIGALHAELCSSITEMKNRYVSACDHHNHSTQSFSAEMALPPGSITYTQSQLTESTALMLSTEFIAQYGSIAAPPTAGILNPEFEALRAKGLRIAERMDFEQKVTKIDKQVMPLDETTKLVETMLKMNELHHCDPLALLKKEFATLFNELAATEAQLALAQEEREVALRSEDIATAEDRGALILALFDKMLSIVKSRCDSSQEHEIQVTDYHSNVDSFIAEEVHIEEAQLKNKILGEEATEDVETIEKAMAKAEVVKSEKSEAYEVKSREFRKAMSSNTAEQVELWEAINNLMAAFPPLLDTRQELVAEQMERVEQHQRSRTEHVSFIATCNERLQQCKDIVTNTTAALELLEQGASYVRDAVVGINKKNVDVTLHNMQKEEKVRYYEVYRRYVLYTGDLVQRKEQRLENNKRMIRSSNFQIDHAVESLDPDLPVYKEQLKLFQKKEIELQDAIATIRTNLSEHQVEWSPIEQALEELEVTIEPPSLLLQELQRDLTEKHAQAVDDLTMTEQRALDQEKNTVRKLHNACTAAKSSIDERRATRQAASPQKQIVK